MKAKLWKNLTVFFMVLVVFIAFFTFASGEKKVDEAVPWIVLSSNLTRSDRKQT